MRSNGSLAWIGERYPFDKDDAPNQYQVWKLEAASPRTPQKLDEGGNIDPRSLAAGRRGRAAPVYWRKGGTVFSATLR
jgi:hypothetical protein